MAVKPYGRTAVLPAAKGFAGVGSLRPRLNGMCGWPSQTLRRHSTDTPESGRIRVRGILHPQQKYPSTRPDGIAQAEMALSSVEGSAVGARAARLTRRDLMRSN